MKTDHDGWTSINTESFSTMTGHYINDQWKLKIVVLETKKVAGSHTAENIKGSLLTTQQQWGLPTPICVTDNADIKRKAFELGLDTFWLLWTSVKSCGEKCLGFTSNVQDCCKGT